MPQSVRDGFDEVPKRSSIAFLTCYSQTYNLVVVGGGTGGLVSAAGSAGVYAKVRISMIILFGV